MGSGNRERCSQVCPPDIWNDCRLLQEEPLRTQFRARDAAEESRTRRGREDWGTAIANMILHSKIYQAAWSQAVRRWVEIIFHDYHEDDAKVARRFNFEMAAKDIKFVKMLVNACWHLHQGSHEQARIDLDKARTAYGFEYCLPCPIKSAVKQNACPKDDTAFKARSVTQKWHAAVARYDDQEYKDPSCNAARNNLVKNTVLKKSDRAVIKMVEASQSKTCEKFNVDARTSDGAVDLGRCESTMDAGVTSLPRTGTQNSNFHFKESKSRNVSKQMVETSPLDAISSMERDMKSQQPNSEHFASPILGDSYFFANVAEEPEKSENVDLCSKKLKKKKKLHSAPEIQLLADSLTDAVPIDVDTCKPDTPQQPGCETHAHVTVADGFSSTNAVEELFALPHFQKKSIKALRFKKKNAEDVLEQMVNPTSMDKTLLLAETSSSMDCDMDVGKPHSAKGLQIAARKPSTSRDCPQSTTLVEEPTITVLPGKSLRKKKARKTSRQVVETPLVDENSSSMVTTLMDCDLGVYKPGTPQQRDGESVNPTTAETSPLSELPGISNPAGGQSKTNIQDVSKEAPQIANDNSSWAKTLFMDCDADVSKPYSIEPQRSKAQAHLITKDKLRTVKEVEKAPLPPQLPKKSITHLRFKKNKTPTASEETVGTSSLDEAPSSDCSNDLRKADRQALPTCEGYVRLMAGEQTARLTIKPGLQNDDCDKNQTKVVGQRDDTKSTSGYAFDCYRDNPSDKGPWARQATEIASPTVDSVPSTVSFKEGVQRVPEEAIEIGSLNSSANTGNPNTDVNAAQEYVTDAMAKVNKRPSSLPVAGPLHPSLPSTSYRQGTPGREFEYRRSNDSQIAGKPFQRTNMQNGQGFSRQSFGDRSLNRYRPSYNGNQPHNGDRCYQSYRPPWRKPETYVQKPPRDQQTPRIRARRNENRSQNYSPTGIAGITLQRQSWDRDMNPNLQPPPANPPLHVSAPRTPLAIRENGKYRCNRRHASTDPYHKEWKRRPTKLEQVVEKEEPAPDMSDWEDDQTEEMDDKESCPRVQLEQITAPPSLHPKQSLPKDFKPKIWAGSRQALCESFQYFRSFQSGVYCVDGIAKGYLLSSFSSLRDKYHHNGKLIISHGGGGSKIFRTGGVQNVTIVADDQIREEGSTRALFQSFKRQIPLVLVIDDKYRPFPFDLGEHTYAVLGYYWIVAAWAEREPANNERGYCVKFKFAFQWCESQGPPWWRQGGQDDDVDPESLQINKEKKNVVICQRLRKSVRRVVRRDRKIKVTNDKESRSKCAMCGSISPTVYIQGWACLYPSCKSFWLLGDSQMPVDLCYDPSFLVLRKEPPQFVKQWDLKLMAVDTKPPDGDNTSKECAKGWWCQTCGRLNSRQKWEYWECPCGNFHQVTGRVREPKEFWPQREKLRFHNHFIHPDSGIKMSKGRWQDAKHGGAMFTYELPNEYGRIHVLQGTPLVNARANELFTLYQTEANNGSFFRRHPLRTHPLRGPLLANHFAHNAGAPYKYVSGDGETVSFDKAPCSVVGALELIKTRVASALNEQVDFNEILSNAYMERQKMSFHTDSEPGLGPIVSSLSLGSTAMMHFRLHASHVPPDTTRYRSLTLVLNHGDVLIMKGYKIQTVYEHTVVPKNFRIAATARCIKPEVYNFY